MNIIEYYLEASKDTSWYDNYSRTGKSSDGKIYRFLNTNYRKLHSFEYYFKKFLQWENIPRNTWSKKETTGQEINKQYVSNMVSTFLFTSRRDNEGNLIYSLTEKGKSFQRFLSLDFSDNEKRLLILLYILNGSFDDEPRSLIKTTSSILNGLIEFEIDIEEFSDELEIFLRSINEDSPTEDIFGYKALWILSFYTDKDFIRLLNIAEESEFEKLFELTKNDYLIKSESNPLSWKYNNQNTTKNTTLDNFLIFYISELILRLRSKSNNLDSFIEFIVTSYNDLYPINQKKVKDFILDDKSNREVFSVIMRSLLSAEDDFTEIIVNDYNPQMKVQEIPTDKIDDTTEKGIEKLEVVRVALKNLAKKKSSYKCELHDLNQCRYFKSRDDENHYLEIHHFVPRQFAYAFEDSIEFVENYVPLCPHCHRMIHNALDDQREILVNYLYTKRQKALEEKLENLDRKKILKFYGLTNG